MIDIFAGTEPSAEWGFGIGGATFFASAVAVWSSIHLRSATDERLHQRVEVAYAGLAEQATETLRKLRDELDLYLPGSSAPFDPQTAFADPANVEQSARKGVAVLRMRGQIRSRFQLMLRICSWLRNGWITFTVGVLATTILYFIFFKLPALWFTVGVVTAAVGLTCTAGLFIYAGLESRIQRAVEASNPIVTGGTP